MAMLKDLIVSGGVILGALKCKGINSSGEIKADNVSLNNSMATLGSSMQVLEIREKHNIIITTKICNISSFYVIFDEISIRRIASSMGMNASYNLTVKFSGGTGRWETQGYKSIKGVENYVALLTISNPYDSTVGSIDSYTGTTKFKISFSEDMDFKVGECILIKYNPSLTKIELE